MAVKFAVKNEYGLSDVVARPRRLLAVSRLDVWHASAVWCGTLVDVSPSLWCLQRISSVCRLSHVITSSKLQHCSKWLSSRRCVTNSHRTRSSAIAMIVELTFYRHFCHSKFPIRWNPKTILI